MNQTTPDPIEGRLGSLVLSGWIAEAPDTGRDAAFLLMTTPDRRAPHTMPLIAEAFGIQPAPGSVAPAPGPPAAISADRWVTLRTVAGEEVSLPVSPEWELTARADGRVVLVVGYRPRGSDVGEDAYTEEVMAQNAFVIGLMELDGTPR